MIPEKLPEILDIVGTSVFACSKCSQALFTEANVVHGDAKACQSYFVVPMKWMQNLESKTNDICCPKCNKKLGVFDWAMYSCNNCNCGQKYYLHWSFLESHRAFSWSKVGLYKPLLEHRSLLRNKLWNDQLCQSSLSSHHHFIQVSFSLPHVQFHSTKL